MFSALISDTSIVLFVLNRTLLNVPHFRLQCNRMLYGKHAHAALEGIFFQILHLCIGYVTFDFHDNPVLADERALAKIELGWYNQDLPRLWSSLT